MRPDIAMKYCAFFLLFILTAMSFKANAGETVTYDGGGATLEGYWAESECENGRDAPLILIAHQWLGLTDYEKGRADMLAEKCYTAFALDMYGQGVRPANFEEAGAESSKYKENPQLARNRLSAALNYATSRHGADDKIAIIGYCFGGTMALELARHGADIDGAVSFHGNLATNRPAQPGRDQINASILVHHGDADTLVPPEEVNTFMQEMEAIDADWTFLRYADAKHSFTEKGADDNGLDVTAYNERADKQSWAFTMAFFDEIFNED